MANCHCPTCGKFFDDWSKTRQHVRMKHNGNGLARIPKQPREKPEPSLANLMVDAEINRAMGVPNEDWIEAMLP